MKRVTALLSLIVAAAVPAAVAHAAPPTATDFAAACAAGPVDVAGTQRYVGGEATLTDPCVVVVHADSKLVLTGVTLSGPGLVVTGSVPNASVSVIDSSLRFAGPLELTAGCCAGDSEVPEHDGTVVIRSSDLLGSSIYVNASFDWPGGRVVIRASRLESTTNGLPDGVAVRASDLGGTDGSITIADSTIVSATSALVRTGTDGRTVVRRNTFSVASPPVVATGTGGTCVARNNIPSVFCS